MPGSERFRTFWQSASARTRLGIAGAAALVAALVIFGIAAAALSMGGDDDRSVVANTPTPAATPTPVPPTPTLQQIYDYFLAISPPTPTATPQFRGGGGGGGGTTVRRNVGTGPGPILTTDIRLQIPKLGLNTAVHSRTVGTNGVMGDPSGPWMVLWYDFRPFSGGVGGYPGEPGANVVFAGHVDYIRVGPAVFYGLKNLAPGDEIIVSGANGPITYAVQWSKMVSPREDFTSYVAKGPPDAVTLVTCIGAFSAGHYTSRLVVRGVRI